MMRVESNRAQGTFNQLRVSLVHGLTYRLLSLYYQIEAIKWELEVRFGLVHVHRVVDDGASAESRRTTV